MGVTVPFVDGALGLIMFGLWLFCILDVITTDASRVRHLPKILWLFIVLLLPDVGSIAWLIAGHTWEPKTAPTRPRRDLPEYDRPGRQVTINPDDDEAFLRQVRARAEEQRRRAEQERKAREAREQQGND
jgi:hypothetical protein